MESRPNIKEKAVANRQTISNLPQVKRMAVRILESNYILAKI